MIAVANSASTPVTKSADEKTALLKEIGIRWNKFSEQELGALKDKDDLVNQVTVKYSQEKAQAQHDVDAILKGRLI